ncbi:MAG: hypothetical protein COB73_00865 [Flavobacteriaceae bacterium]|nr:MAG: hypothetical protein COB73_00865 [Flavobacteriaceae bacterium]
MKNLTIVRRTSHHAGHTVASLKIEYPQARFLISKKGAELMEVKHEDGLMFGFNYKAKTAYAFKDDEIDSFRLYEKGKNDKGMRFTSKDLMNHFIDCFDLEIEKHVYFNIVKDQDKFKLMLKK